MKHYTKKAIKSGISAGIGFGIVTAGIDLYDRDDFELWKFILKILLFTVFMGLYFNYSLKKQSDKKS
jgi:hypothetical protein